MRRGYGTARRWHISKPGWLRVEGKFEGGALRGVLKNGAVVTYKPQPDGTLHGTYELNGYSYLTTLNKMGGGN